MKRARNKKPGKVVGIRPTGIQILIENLTAQEMSGGSVIVGDDSDVGTPQAYILAIGPGMNPDDNKLGFKVGDRVIVVGKYTPVPKPAGQKRELGIIDYTNIKAVIEEEDESTIATK